MSKIVNLTHVLEEKANREGWYRSYESMRVMEWFSSTASLLIPFLEAAVHGDNDAMSEHGYEADVIQHDGALVSKVVCESPYDESKLKEISAGKYELVLEVFPDGMRRTTYRKKLLGEL